MDLDGDLNRQAAAWLLNGLRLLDGRLISGPSLSTADWHLVGRR